MNRTQNVAAILVLTILFLGLLIVAFGGYLPSDKSELTPSPTTNIPTRTPHPSISLQPSPSQTSNPTSTNDTTPTYTYQIINTYPHDTHAFTQGLIFHNGTFYESTGSYGSSNLRRVEIVSGKVLQEKELSNIYFGEGLALVDDSLVQLTWLEKVGFVYDLQNFAYLQNFSYSTEGWGLTYDGTSIIMSDGSSNLYFLNPRTFEVTGQVSVKDGSKPVTNINELEYIDGDVYANIFMDQKIAIINPQTGQIKGWIDLSGIYRSDDPNSVLNGIAYDPQNERLFITGKNWPNLYEIRIVLKP